MVAVLGATQPSASIHAVPSVVDNDVAFCPLFPSGNPNSSVVFQWIFGMDGSVWLCVLIVLDVPGEVEAGSTVSVSELAIIGINEGALI